MSKKNQSKVSEFWQTLQNKVVKIDEDNFLEILDAIKSWILDNEKSLGQDRLHREPSLSLLLSSDASNFPMNRPLAGKHVKGRILSNLYPPQKKEEIVSFLESIIQEFAVFTKWEDCPACNEGYLGYWIEPTSKTLVLKCPECWWEQDIEGNQWTSSLVLIPASMQDLQEVSTGE
jgi:hypothetical protein